MFGFDTVEVEWFASDDEIGLVGVWVERFGGAVYDEVFEFVFPSKCWTWGEGGGWSERVCGGCHPSGVYI